MYVFPEIHFLNGEPSFQYQKLIKKRELIIIKKKKSCLGLMNRLNSLKHFQHYNAHNSN